MIMQPLAFLIFIFLNLQGDMPLARKPVDCAEAHAGAASATLFAKDTVFISALNKIKMAYNQDKHEHCISFGTGTGNLVNSSAIMHGGSISGKVPAIANAFADLHNHPDNMPPDAGDLYGLIAVNKNNHNYKTRFVLTSNGTLYALLVTDTARAAAFTTKHPAQPPAFRGGPPGLPVALVDEGREMKYAYQCTDEMVVAFILEKYDAGVCLLKQQHDGRLSKLYTTLLKSKTGLVYSPGVCP